MGERTFDFAYVTLASYDNQFASITKQIKLVFEMSLLVFAKTNYFQISQIEIVKSKYLQIFQNF